MIQTRTVVPPDIADLHVQFLGMLPIVEGYAEAAHKSLANYHDREDAIAETVALVWSWYYRLTRRGKQALFNPTMMTQAAVRFVKAGQGLCNSNGI